MHGIVPEVRNIKEDPPSYEELLQIFHASGLPIKRLFNTSGLLYKELGLKEKLLSMSEEAQLRLLATDGMLIKRPILWRDGVVLVGFREAQWAEVFGV